MIWRKKTDFMDWDEYKSKMDLLDLFYWQQSVRKHNTGL
jgi:hypothetical protein